MSYGWQRAELLGALYNGVFLLALSFSVMLDAIERFFKPEGTLTSTKENQLSSALLLILLCTRFNARFHRH